MNFRSFINEDNESINEGEIWDMIKSTAKMVSDLKKVQSEFAKAGKKLKSGVNSQEEYEYVLKIIETAIKNAKHAIYSADSFDDEFKKSSFENFVKSFRNIGSNDKINILDPELKTALVNDIQEIVRKYE
jgi:hypothetical protein